MSSFCFITTFRKKNSGTTNMFWYVLGALISIFFSLKTSIWFIQWHYEMGAILLSILQRRKQIERDQGALCYVTYVIKRLCGKGPHAWFNVLRLLSKCLHNFEKEAYVFIQGNENFVAGPAGWVVQVNTINIELQSQYSIQTVWPLLALFSV